MAHRSGIGSKCMQNRKLESKDARIAALEKSPAAIEALLTRAAYALSSPERLVSKSEVVRLAIEKIARELEEGKAKEELEALLKHLKAEEGEEEV